MTRRIVRTVCFAILLLGPGTLAPAQERASRQGRPGGQDRPCTMAGRAGDYGYTWTGTMFLPTGPVPVAAVGRPTFDDAGNMWGKQTVSRGGTITEFTLKGTYTIEPDCTGTITVEVYTLSGSLSSTATWATVTVDNMAETYATMTSNQAGKYPDLDRSSSWSRIFRALAGLPDTAYAWPRPATHAGLRSVSGRALNSAIASGYIRFSM